MDPRTENLPQNRSQPKPKPNLCPFGCAESDHDERGYCRHLVGWTLHEQDDAGRTKMDMRKPIPGTDREKAQHDSTDPRCFIDPKSDVVVPMATPTSRVYRPQGPHERVVNHASALERNADATRELLGQQEQTIAELREQREDDRRRLEELEKKLTELVGV